MIALCGKEHFQRLEGKVEKVEILLRLDGEKRTVGKNFCRELTLKTRKYGFVEIKHIGEFELG